MKALARFLITTLVLSGTVLADDQPKGFPHAPRGYEWYVFEPGKLACLRPLDWFVKTEVKGDTAALFFSKEDIDREGQFKTGMTLNVVRGIHKKTGKPPSLYAKSFLEALIEKHPDARRIENLDQSGMPGIGTTYLDREAFPDVVVYTFLLPDDESDILRVFILESPQEDWAQVWASRRQMLDCRIRR